MTEEHEDKELMRTWLANAEISSGPVFRPVLKGQHVQAAPLTPHSAAQIVKRYVERVGLDAQAFAGYSLRPGFLTSAAETEASVFKMLFGPRSRRAGAQATVCMS